MASSRSFLDYVLEQLTELDNVSYRPMMGEYILYYEEKIFGGIYDDRLLVKPVKSALNLIEEPKYEIPYEGAKPMLLVEDIDNRRFLCELVEKMANDLPSSGRRKK